jgi:tetratricopeptide (TPR) repeat protein
LAVTIAEAIPPTAYPAVTLAQIKAMAWKDRATALRFLGRIPETFESIRRAEEILDKHVALGLDRAVVDLVKALTLLNTNECDEARAIAITCGSVFLAHGDLDRALQAGEIEGHVLFEKQRYGDAQTLFTSLLEIARVINDVNAQARCHHNAGYCAVNLGEFKNANIHFSEAISKLTDLGKPVAASRTQWGVGQVLIGKGQVDSGLKHLYAAREAFIQHELFEEAGLCGLSIAEALLSRGAEKEARDIVHEVATEFSESPIERRIVDAVVALEQTMFDGGAPLEAVRNVYALIESQSKHAAL